MKTSHVVILALIVVLAIVAGSALYIIPEGRQAVILGGQAGELLRRIPLATLSDTPGVPLGRGVVGGLPAGHLQEHVTGLIGAVHLVTQRRVDQLGGPAVSLRLGGRVQGRYWPGCRAEHQDPNA